MLKKRLTLGLKDRRPGATLSSTCCIAAILFGCRYVLHDVLNPFHSNKSIFFTFKVLYDAKILGKFCGHENSADGHHPGNQPILSPGNRLSLTFQTDNNNPERHQNVGFSAQYQAIGSTRLVSVTSLFNYGTTSR